MTLTTKLFITHEELKKFSLTVDDLKNMGYYIKERDAVGIIFEKPALLKFTTKEELDTVL